MAVKCTNCGGAHPSWDCSKPTKSTAARKDVQADRIVTGQHQTMRSGNDDKPDGIPWVVEAAGNQFQIAGNQALPVDTPPKPKMGRPRTGYIKAEYNRQYSADQRTIKRLGLNCTVKEWREKNASGLA